MCPVMEGSDAIAANAFSDNLLQGEAHQYLQGHARVRLLATGSAAGLRYWFTAQPDVIAQDASLNANNRQPNDDTDVLAEENVAGGTQLDLRARNTTAGALTIFWRVRVDYF